MTDRRRSVIAVGLACLLAIAGIVSLMGNGPIYANSSQPASENASAAGVQPIDGCGEIDAPGRYVLTRDVINDTSTRTTQNCIWITANDVVLDGDGHRIDGIGVSDSTGVRVGTNRSRSNVTVSNLSVSDWHTGVGYYGVSDPTLRSVTATDNAVGLGLTNASDARVTANDVRTNLIGLRVQNSTLAALSNNTYRENYGSGLDDRLSAVGVGGRAITVGPPLDLDDDGRYEDVTGDRERTVADAVALFGLVSADAAGTADLRADHRQLLDLDRDGTLDYGDVWTALNG